MATPVGHCSHCQAANSYAATNCVQCGMRLSWADAVQLAGNRGHTIAEQPVQSPAAKPVKWFLIIGSLGLMILFGALVILQIIGVMISGGV